MNEDIGKSNSNVNFGVKESRERVSHERGHGGNGRDVDSSRIINRHNNRRLFSRANCGVLGRNVLSRFFGGRLLFIVLLLLVIVNLFDIMTVGFDSQNYKGFEYFLNVLSNAPRGVSLEALEIFLKIDISDIVGVNLPNWLSWLVYPLTFLIDIFRVLVFFATMIIQFITYMFYFINAFV